MQAIILAGGKGTRLRPYTSVLPKPLMPVGEMPILEIVVFLIMGLSFAFYAWNHIHSNSSKSSNTLPLIGSTASCGLLTCRELYQMYSARQLELKKVDEDTVGAEFNKLGKLGWAWRIFAFLVTTLVYLSIVLGVGLPFWIVYFCVVVAKMCLQCCGKDVYSYPSLIAAARFYEDKVFYKIGDFFGEKILICMLHDPLTFLGLPRSWRGSAFNWWV